MALLLQFLMLLLAVGTSLGQCPPREDILPCSCTVNNWGNRNVKVLCWKVDDVDAVRRALQSAKGIPLLIVQFENSQLGSVPSDLFKGLLITHVYFNNCVLKKIGDEERSALEGLEDLIQFFRVQSSFPEDSAVKLMNVSRLNALKYLHIGKNSLKELSNEWFAEGPANLRELVVNSNKITKLGDRAFAPLINIRKIWLWDNQIEILARSMFPSPAVHLETIHLSENKILTLPVDMFSDMPALKDVFLDRNSITSIPEATWKPVWCRLEYLHLDENPLNCNEDIKWTLKEKRPFTLKGKCVSPYERNGMDLEKIIDDTQRRA